MITRLRYPKGYQFFDANGLPLALGNLYYYVAGTTTPQDTYSDSAGTIMNTNPIVLDGSGRLDVDVHPRPCGQLQGNIDRIERNRGALARRQYPLCYAARLERHERAEPDPEQAGPRSRSHLRKLHRSFEYSGA